MPRRRANSEGSIYKRCDGRWVAQLQVGLTEDGKPIRRMKYARTKGKALEGLDEMRGTIQKHGALPASGRLTVADYLKEWLEQKREKWRWRTHDEYSRLVRRDLNPVLGHVRLDAVTPAHIKHVLRGKTPRHALKVYRVLSASLNEAVKDELITHNPIRHVDTPEYAPAERPALNEDEARRLIETTREEWYFPAILLALACGMRAGEIWGLTWRCVDLEEGTLRIEKTLNFKRWRVANDLAASLEPPKSKRSRRTVPLPDFVVAALSEHRDCQLIRSLHDLVFTTPSGEPVRHDGFYAHTFVPMLKRAELPPIRFHDLRHSAVTMLLRAGVAMEVVSSLVGHHSPSFTLATYRHVLEDENRAAAAKMQKLLGGA